MSKLVRVELSPLTGRPVRIFRKDKKWLTVPQHLVIVMDRGDAVEVIREQVFERCRVEDFTNLLSHHECEHCGRWITWDTMEMNEIQFKGKGGEVSLENCEGLCHDCHQGSPDSVHGDRRWQTAKLKETNGPS